MWNNKTSWWCTIKKASYPDGNGILAFIRLVASAYIIKHQIVFGDFLKPGLFVLVHSSDDIIQKHYNFYNNVTPITIIDIQSESDNADLDSSDDELTGKEEYYCL